MNSFSPMPSQVDLVKFSKSQNKRKENKQTEKQGAEMAVQEAGWWKSEGKNRCLKDEGDTNVLHTYRKLPKKKRRRVENN